MKGHESRTELPIFTKIKTPLTSNNMITPDVIMKFSYLVAFFFVAVTNGHQSDRKIITLFWDSTPLKLEHNLSPECQSSLKDIIGNKSISPFVDNSGGVPSGISDGTLISFGNYDGCLSIESSKYCLLKFSLSEKKGILHDAIEKNLNVVTRLQFMVGVCVPDVCYEDDIRKVMLNSDGDILIFNHTSRINCNRPFSISTTLSNISLMQVGSLVLILLMASTAVHYTFRGNGSQQMINIFSIKKNWRSLVADSRNREDDVDNLRTIFTVVVILMHSGFCVTEFHTAQMGGESDPSFN